MENSTLPEPDPNPNITNNVSSEFTNNPADQIPVSNTLPTNPQSPEPKKNNSFLLVAIIIIVLIISLAVGFFVLSTPTIKKLTSCMENYMSDIEVIDQKKSDASYTKEQFCVDDKGVVTSYGSCVDNAKMGSIIPSNLTLTVAGLINPSVNKTSKEAVTSMHNQFCVAYSQSLIN